MKDNDQKKAKPTDFKRLLLRTIDVILVISSFVLLLLTAFITFTLLPKMNEIEASGGNAFNNALLSLVAGFLIAFSTYFLSWQVIKRVFKKRPEVKHYRPMLDSPQKEIPYENH